jgi:hypothetical protein
VSSSDSGRQARASSAARQATPLRLILGDRRDSRVPPLNVAASVEEAPLLVARLGSVDVDAYLAVATALEDRPGGVIVGLTELARTVETARAAARRQEVPFLPDPVTFRTGLEGARTPGRLKKLEFRPPGGKSIWSPELLADQATAERFAHAVAYEEFEAGADVLVGPAFALRSPMDAWMPIARDLHARFVVARGAFGALSVLAPLIVTAAFESLEAQRAALGVLRAQPPEAVLLLADGLHADARPEQLAATLRLALLLQAAVGPVLLGRAVALRDLAWALGVAGVEGGLGRLDGLRLTDYVGSGGGGHVPPRFEFPSLLCALPRPLALAVLASELVPEATCECVGCQSASTPHEQVERTVAHNASVTFAEPPSLAGRAVLARIDALTVRVDRARWLVHDLVSDGVLGGPLVHHERWLRCLDLALAWGLADPGHVADLVAGKGT